jgi:segregation and condensation protein A
MSEFLSKETYNIHLPVFDGPFDLLLFFIERDELDIQNIPISRITGDFLDYIRTMEAVNIELASEFIVTAATLMRIKAKMLLPLHKNEETNEVDDPRSELVNRILVFKSFKEVAEELSRLENERAQLHIRGNIEENLKQIQKASVSYNELESANLYNLMKTFNRLMARLEGDKHNKIHQLVNYPYTIEESKEDILKSVRQRGRCSFEQLFDRCESRIHAIVQFLSILELINQQLIEIINTSDVNSFWITEKSSEDSDNVPFT